MKHEKGTVYETGNILNVSISCCSIAEFVHQRFNFKIDTVHLQVILYLMYTFEESHPLLLFTSDSSIICVEISL